jgi:uncharacterized iron-regulated protein
MPTRHRPNGSVAARRTALRHLAGALGSAGLRIPLLRAAGIGLGASMPGCALGPAEPPLPWPTRPVLLLGEVHDNPEHHRLRAEGLRQWLASGPPTTVLFEQMDRDRNPAVRAAQAEANPAVRRDPARLQDLADRVALAGGLSAQGWGWPLHRPIVEACLAAGASIGGANLPLTEVRGIVRGGLSAAPADVRSAIEGDSRWTPALQSTLEGLIDSGHCGVLPPARWPAMALAQRARDVSMALAVRDALGGAAGSGRVALIAGNGHVRRDLGVPHALESLGMAADRIHAVAYLEQGPHDAAELRLYDQVVHTRRQPRPDPCEAFRARPAGPAS